MRAEFTDELMTGNKLIDSQHEELIGRMNKLLDSCEINGGKVAAVNTLDYLSEYTNFHFADEEKLQQEVGYPEYEKHLAQHAVFKKTIAELSQMLEEEDGPTEDFVKKVEENLVKWFYVHISGFDRSVAEYINIRENGGRL